MPVLQTELHYIYIYIIYILYQFDWCLSRLNDERFIVSRYRAVRVGSAWGWLREDRWRLHVWTGNSTQLTVSANQHCWYFSVKRTDWSALSNIFYYDIICKMVPQYNQYISIWIQQCYHVIILHTLLGSVSPMIGQTSVGTYYTLRRACQTVVFSVLHRFRDLWLLPKLVTVRSKFTKIMINRIT